MNVTEQLDWERGVRLRYAVISAIAGAMLVISAIIQLSGPHTNVDELTLDLLTAHKRFPLDLIGAIVDGLGLAAVAATLNFLNGITRARNPEVRSFIRWLAVGGAILSAVMAVAYAIVIASKANTFASDPQQTYMQANALTTGGLIVALPLLAQLGSLLLTAGFIWISLNALRVGLLTRFLGYLGVFAGALVLFPIGSPVPVVQGFWLVAFALMAAGRWPAGQPPTWEHGTAMPWGPLGKPRESSRPASAPAAPPTSVRRPRRSADAVALAEVDDTAHDNGEASGRTRSNTPKRKRKRRG